MTYIFGNDAFWIKAAEFIFWAKRSPPLFSEREGIERFRRLPFTCWRFQFKQLNNQQTKQQGANNQ